MRYGWGCRLAFRSWAVFSAARSLGWPAVPDCRRQRRSVQAFPLSTPADIFEDAVLNFLLVGIPDLTVALVGYGVRVFIVCSDCDGSFLLRLTEPDMTVRLPRALDSVSAELLLGAKPPTMVSCVLCSATRCSRRLRQ